MRLEDYPTEPRYSATVLRSEEITEEGTDVEVRELVLEVDKSPDRAATGLAGAVPRVLTLGPRHF